MSEQPGQEYQPPRVELNVRTRRGVLIGLIPDYRGPIPRKGETITRPQLDGVSSPRAGRHETLTVRQVSYDILAPDPGEKYLKGSDFPIVTLFVSRPQRDNLDDDWEEELQNRA